MSFTESVGWLIPHHSTQLVNLLIEILSTIPGSPEASDTGPEDLDRLFITACGFTEQGKVKRSATVELLAPRKHLAAPHAEVLCIAQQNTGQVIFRPDTKQISVGRLKLRCWGSTVPGRQKMASVILGNILI